MLLSSPLNDAVAGRDTVTVTREMAAVVDIATATGPVRRKR